MCSLHFAQNWMLIVGCSTAMETFASPAPSSTSAVKSTSPKLKQFQVTAEDCVISPLTFRGREGLIHGFKVIREYKLPENFHLRDNFTKFLFPGCNFFLETPRSTFVYLKIKHSKCVFGKSDKNMILIERTGLHNGWQYNITCDMAMPQTTQYLTTLSNRLHFFAPNGPLRMHWSRWGHSSFTIKFMAAEGSRFLPVVNLSAGNCSGYVTSPAFDEGFRYPDINKVWSREVPVPKGHGVMVSFPHFHLVNAVLELYIEKWIDGRTLVLNETGQKSLPAQVFSNLSQLIVHFKTHSGGRREEFEDLHGFKLLYSFHQINYLPEKVSNELFNCSVDYYPSWRQHLDCNLETECLNGDDETEHCPFSNAACKGHVAAGNKCLFLVPNQKALSVISKKNWHKAWVQCKVHNGRLVTVINENDMKSVSQILTYSKYHLPDIFVGMLRKEEKKLSMYAGTLQWVDIKSIIHSQEYYRSWFAVNILTFKGCGLLKTMYRSLSTTASTDYRDILARIDDVECWSEMKTLNVCERELPVKILGTIKPIELERVSLPDEWPERINRTNNLIFCPRGHVAHKLCDPRSACGQERPDSSCPFDSIKDGPGSESAREETLSVSMFSCGDGVITIHYSLVCNFIKDCPGNSDETFCRHPPCNDGFRCRNGQCLSKHGCCSRYSYRRYCYRFGVQCLDGSDSYNCDKPIVFKMFPRGMGANSNVLLLLDGKGGFSIEKSEKHNSSFFRCPGKINKIRQTYSVPVYTRCNGFKDCLGGEDEQGCEDPSCPGYYRCRDSKVCVHPDHMCDGWPQCPQQDDEWLCEEKACPEGCLCQGLAFLCHQSFRHNDFPALRYLHIEHAQFDTSTLHHLQYLVYLKIQNCSLMYFPNTDLSNLRLLDLSSNLITSVNIDTDTLPNMKTLVLAGNPLVTFVSKSSGDMQNGLEVLDLSHTRLQTFDSKNLAVFGNLRRLNLSYSLLVSLDEESFQHFSQLQNIDLRHNSLDYFYPALFKGLNEISLIQASNYRLCCLDNVSPTMRCISDEAPLSSCERLLRSQSHQIALYVLSFTAFLGNIVCVLTRYIKYREFSTNRPFSIMMSSLNAAHFSMSIYCCIIASADEWFRAVYVRHESEWINSTLCTTAGFLSLLSQTVSALMTLLIVLDRLLDTGRGDSTSWHFNDRTTLAAVSLAWAMGIGLSTALLLSRRFSQRTVDSQSGLCVPLPLASHSTEEIQIFLIQAVLCLVTSVSVMTMVNFVKGRMRNYSQQLHFSTESLHFRLNRQLVNVVISCCLCWAFVGLVGLLVLINAGSVEAMISIVMAIFVLPLSSALTPCSYIVAQITEDRREKSEQRLLNLLKLKAELRMTLGK